MEHEFHEYIIGKENFTDWYVVRVQSEILCWPFFALIALIFILLWFLWTLYKIFRVHVI